MKNIHLLWSAQPCQGSFVILFYRMAVEIVCWSVDIVDEDYTQQILNWIDDLSGRPYNLLPHFLISPFGKEYTSVCKFID